MLPLARPVHRRLRRYCRPQSILPSGNSWAFNTQATDATGATNALDFHLAWTDNRDVVAPPAVNGSQDWTQ